MEQTNFIWPQGTHSVNFNEKRLKNWKQIDWGLDEKNQARNWLEVTVWVTRKLIINSNFWEAEFIKQIQYFLE